MQTLKTNSQLTGKPTRLGIISALAEEQEGLIHAMRNAERHVHGMREYTVGNLWNVDTVAVLSRIGKVAAATTTLALARNTVFDVTGSGSLTVGASVTGSSSSSKAGPWMSTATWAQSE